MSARAYVRCLTIPGLHNSGHSHWQSRWEKTRENCKRVELGSWHDPYPADWISKLDSAILSDDWPKILIAHSLGCLTVAQWTTQANTKQLTRVRGALLVAPPDVDHSTAKPVLQRFGPAPREILPIRAILVANRNDPCASIAYSEKLAFDWGACFVDAGHCGHINAESNLGDWPDGQLYLSDLVHWDETIAVHKRKLKTAASIRA